MENLETNVDFLVKEFAKAEGPASQQEHEVWARLYERIHNTRFDQAMDALARRDFQSSQYYMDISMAAEKRRMYHEEMSN